MASQGATAEALSATEEVVSLYRKLCATDGAEFTPSLARALVDYSRRLAWSEDWPRAASACEEAVALYRQLLVSNPREFMSGYAAATSMHAALRMKTGFQSTSQPDIPDFLYFPWTSTGDGADDTTLHRLIPILISAASALREARFHNGVPRQVIDEYMVEIRKPVPDIAWTKIWALGLSIQDAINAHDASDDLSIRAKAFLRVHAAAVMQTNEGRQLEELSARGGASIAAFANLGSALVEMPQVAPPVQTVASSYYQFSAKETAVSVGLALVLWGLIVGAASAATHAWAGPLAAILGLALAPVGLLGGLRRRA